MSDPVEHPSHYTSGPPCSVCGTPIECITITERHNFNVGNAIKYLWRAGKKDTSKNLEDIRKAHWYVCREIERLEKAIRSPVWPHMFLFGTPKESRRAIMQASIEALCTAKQSLEDEVAALAEARS